MTGPPLLENDPQQPDGSDTSSHGVGGFWVEIDRGGGITRVAPVGELDLESAQKLDAVLGQALDAGGRDVVLDLRRLTFIDSSGIHLVMRWSSTRDERLSTFAVVHGGPKIRRLFEIVGLLDRLPFVEPDADPGSSPPNGAQLFRPRRDVSP